MQKRTDVKKPGPEEMKHFSAIGSAISKSSTTFTPKFVAGQSMQRENYKQVHVEKVPAVAMSADLHETLETMGMIQLKGAMGLPDSAPLDVATASFTTTDVNAGICATGCITQQGSEKKAFLAFVATETERQASWSRLEGLLLHWACSSSPGSGWAMPPQGWQPILPKKSSDAGGAIQSPFEKASLSGSQQQLYVLVLSLPLSGILRSGGITFVLKASNAQNTKWLKDAETNGDFFVDVHSLPYYKA